MIRKILGGLSLPVILLIAYILIGFGSGIMSGETDFVMWVGEHKLLLAIIATWLVTRIIR